MTTAVLVYFWFASFFAVARLWAEKKGTENVSLHATGVLSFLAISFAFVALGKPSVAIHPTLPLVLFVLSDTLLGALSVKRPPLRFYHLFAGVVVFVGLLNWTLGFLTPALLPHALVAYLLVGLLHGGLAVRIHRREEKSLFVPIFQLYPILLILPLLVAILRNVTSPVLLWPVIFLMNAIVIGGALATGFLWAIVGALLMSLLSVIFWVPRLTESGLPTLLVVILGLAGLFFAVGVWLIRQQKKANASEDSSSPSAWDVPPILTESLPALGALLPFLLLGQAAVHLRLANPSPIFGLGALLVFMLVGLAFWRGGPSRVLVLVSFLAVTLLHFIWYEGLFTPERLFLATPWTVGVFAFFALLPFVSKRFAEFFESWLTSAVAGPFLFYLFFQAYSKTLGPATIGVLPAVFAVFYLGALIRLVKIKETLPRAQTVLALFGGVALFFVSLIFPLQFSKEWLTLAWALEGFALVWLFHRVPHPGLKVWGATLLIISFLRLSVNPAVLDYHPRAPTPLFNWFLYTYGVVTGCLFAAAKRWGKSLETGSEFLKGPWPGIFQGMATVLLFLLMNIQIADFFSNGSTLTFDLKGSLVLDTTYTLGWALFGLILLVVGLWKQERVAQRASFALLAVTIGKLFLHDVWRLTQLYRAGAFAGLAVILILASFLYQRFMKKTAEVNP